MLIFTISKGSSFKFYFFLLQRASTVFLSRSFNCIISRSARSVITLESIRRAPLQSCGTPGTKSVEKAALINTLRGAPKQTLCFLFSRKHLLPPKRNTQTTARHLRLWNDCGIIYWTLVGNELVCFMSLRFSHLKICKWCLLNAMKSSDWVRKSELW